MQASAIIPSYNEGNTILEVVEELKKSPLIKEIIVVDDGSDDKCKKILKKIEKQVTLLVHKKNKGKSAALKTGILKAKQNCVVFLDADLINFKKEHAESLINKLEKEKKVMVLGRIGKEKFPYGPIGFSLAYTGQRAFSKKILLKNINLFDNKSYLIEPSLNKLFFGRYPVGIVVLKDLCHVSKIQKWKMGGLISEIKMLKDLFSSFGLKEVASQIKFTRELSKRENKSFSS